MSPTSQRTLSKSDFKLGRTCPVKLYYREHGYPDNGADSPMLQMLADSGYRVEALAKALRPDGIPLPRSGDPAEAFALTREHLTAPVVTLFEATILAGRRLARVDILEKNGDEIRLIEVKAKSFDSIEHEALLASGKGGLFRKAKSPHEIEPTWRPYLEDITYQTLVFRSAFPALEVTPHLLLVDKARKTGSGYVPLEIAVEYEDCADGTSRLLGARYVGDSGLLAEADLLFQVDVSSEVEDLSGEVAEAARVLEGIVIGCDANEPRPTPTLGVKCKGCDFRVQEGTGRSGFAECWGEMANVHPHILDLYQGGKAMGPSGLPLADEMALRGEASLLAVPEAPLSGGSHDRRRAIQVGHSRSRTRWVSPELKEIIASVTYPLHFIDFEASSPPIPYHAGMAAYERVAFQLSCHTMAAEGVPPTHKEWLNDGLELPDATFAAELRGAIGDKGTVLIWSPYETVTMKMVAERLKAGTAEAAELAGWLLGQVESERILDLNEVTLRHFFHPDMGGRTSIKVVLDALWRSDEPMRRQLESWTGRSIEHRLSPYATLPPIAMDGLDGLNEIVQEGSGAVLAYEEMLYGRGKRDPAVRANQRSLLLQYCALDTMAMALIWEYWRRALPGGA